MFRELVERHITNRGNIVEAGNIRPDIAEYCRYASLFIFDKNILSYVKINRSVKDYKGNIYADAIWFDVDDEKNNEKSRKDALELIRRLNHEYDLDPEDLFIYFSGNKGYHIALHGNNIQLTPSSPVTAEQVKQFVSVIAKGIESVDYSIYEPLRIFRIENSKHEKSSLYKIRLTFDELLNYNSDYIRNLAKSPRKNTFHKPISEIKINGKLFSEWQNTGYATQEKNIYSGNGNLFSPPEKGRRNKTLFVQACTLLRKSELSTNAIFEILSCINYCSQEPLPAHELKTLFRSAEKSIKDRPESKESKLDIRSFGEWLPEWESFAMAPPSKLTMIFEEINMHIKGRLKGKLGVVMGYGGSKKSLYCLNVALVNARLYNEVCVYSTMEMGVNELINRIIDHEVNTNDYNRASDVVYSMFQKDTGAGRSFLKQLAQDLGNKLQIIPNGRMTARDYDIALQTVTERVGKPSILIVDGLSLMGGKGTETEMYSQNSADLKELANKWNILILLIAHVSKGAEFHTRDLSRFLRGSEKILDNCDFYMTLSQIQDEQKAFDYRKDIGFINFKHKRGDGVSVDMIYSFESKRLAIRETALNAFEFRESKILNGKKAKIDDPF